MTGEPIIVEGKAISTRVRFGEWSIAKYAEKPGEDDEKHGDPAKSLDPPQRARMIEILVDLDRANPLQISHRLSRK